MKKIFCSLFLLFVLSSAKGINDPNKSDSYNFGFEKDFSMIKNIDNWQITGGIFKLQLDSFVVKFGNNCAKVTAMSSPFPEAKTLTISQSFYLPLEANKINFSIWLKSLNNCTVAIKTTLLDVNEDTVKCETIRYAITNEWKNYAQTIKGNSIRLLNVEIILEQNTQVWLDQFQLNINGKPFYKYLSQIDNKKLSYNPLNQKDIIKISPEDTIDNEIISDLHNKRIVGIGESVHGLHEMAIDRNRLIKALVMSGKCKLVVFEAEDYYLEILNNYIQGVGSDEDIFKSKDFDNVQYYIYSDEMLQLVKWLREYNKTATKKVIIAGMDVSFEWIKQIEKILNENSNSPAIQELTDVFRNKYVDIFREMVVDKKEQLIPVLSSKTYSDLLRFTTNFSKRCLAYRAGINDRYRDSIMAQNVKELVEKYTINDEMTIVWGHLGHLNKLKLPNIPTTSMGRRLYEYYGENYFVIAQLVGKGNFRASLSDSRANDIYSLNVPVEGSIEYICSKEPFNTFWFSTTQFDKYLMTYRETGAVWGSKQFYPGNTNRRFDAILFEQEGTPLNCFRGSSN